MPATWLADVLRGAGLPVDESKVPDWKTRSHTDGPFAPVGVLGHHTAGAKTGDLPSLGIVRDGRADLAGPLANLMLSRSGVWVPIAAGRAWHAGAADNRALWPWVPKCDGNGYLLGIEAESAGTGDWTPAQLTAYPRGVAALLAHLGADSSRFLFHKTWAPSRKVDPAGWPGDLAGFRKSISAPVEDVMTPAQEAKLDKVLAFIDWYWTPDTPGQEGPSSKGEYAKRIRSIDVGVAALVGKAPGAVDAAGIAAAIAAQLPALGAAQPVSQADLEAALRKVLSSIPSA